MKPPLCLVCGSTDRATQFTVVHFAINDQEKAAFARREAAHWVGHPENAYWFCAEHLHFGTERQSMHWRDAVADILAVTDNYPRRPPGP
ncbi:hypothetical protein ACFFMR_14510 [Micromonospora andamanensis]|uniref:Uncharacterized protein n=1 Tax=Micromonospora andamanensis TaxID=1287068 RepID=A0ABQ4I4E0_9ACTN|nr:MULTISPECIES: hypothetical protein [Micromonospora]WFE47699.1 hypothetical protein O7624_26900 [Verrucosispora sp. WMMD1129]GIJ12767.1 hypothetical protein Van01_59810 [Micromonospora andamanensis]